MREAIENGEFDNLPGKGEPIDLSENPFEDPDLRVVHRLQRNVIQFSSVLPLCSLCLCGELTVPNIDH